MKRIALSGGDEFDVFSCRRRFYITLRRSGYCRAIKRRYNKRFRKAAKQEIQSRTERTRGGDTQRQQQEPNKWPQYK